MHEKCVPLTMGSPRFRSLDVGPFNLVEAWFPPRLVLPPHLHDRTTFAVMLEGSFDVGFASATYACEPSSVFTEPLGDKHGNKVGAKPAHVVVLQPDHARSDLFDPCRSIFNEATHFSHGGIHSLGWRLAYELRAPDSTSGLSMQGLGLEMLALACRVEAPREARPPEWFESAMDMIHSTFLGKLSIEDVAREIDVHPTHLARAFRKYHRESIGGFVRRLRLGWATDRLLASDDSIAQIALDAGFSDQSHFTRLFKRQTGVSPGRYRRGVRV